jgi:hypothetical protein
MADKRDEVAVGVISPSSLAVAFRSTTEVWVVAQP